MDMLSGGGRGGCEVRGLLVVWREPFGCVCFKEDLRSRDLCCVSSTTNDGGIYCQPADVKNESGAVFRVHVPDRYDSLGHLGR